MTPVLPALGLAAGMAAAFAVAPAAAEEELEIEFRYWTDPSGTVERQYIDVEDGELEIRHLRGSSDTAVDDDTLDALRSAISSFVQSATLELGDVIPAPFVEVRMEYEGNAIDVEITKVYPEGQVPADLVALQRQYFETVFE